MINSVLYKLNSKELPYIQGYNGDYVNEDYVLEVFEEAHEELQRSYDECNRLRLERLEMCKEINKLHLKNVKLEEKLKEKVKKWSGCN